MYGFLLEHLTRILDSSGCLLEAPSPLFELLPGLLEQLANILELPDFIRRFFMILELIQFY